MIETAVVVGLEDQVLYWHQPPGASAGGLPDSTELWGVIWERRAEIQGIAHTHPWNGEAWPSLIDLSTFKAVEQALGRPLVWWVVTFTEVRRVVRNPNRDGWNIYPPITPDPPWVEELRARSRATTVTL